MVGFIRGNKKGLVRISGGMGFYTPETLTKPYLSSGPHQTTITIILIYAYLSSFLYSVTLIILAW